MDIHHYTQLEDFCIHKSAFHCGTLRRRNTDSMRAAFVCSHSLTVQFEMRFALSCMLSAYFDLFTYIFLLFFLPRIPLFRFLAGHVDENRRD